MIGRRSALALPLLAVAPRARAALPGDRAARLRRGLNVTNWFRFPRAMSPEFFRTYVSDAEIRQFRAWGFDYIRLPVQPELLRDGNGRFLPERFAAVVTAVRRLQAGGLAVMVELHPHRWQLETQEAHRRALTATWRALAERLAPLDPDATFAEILNEPVFDKAPDRWQALQAEVAAAIRAAMPRHTIIATGHHWSNLDGLLALRPLPDPNVAYTFHYYRPMFWTTLGAAFGTRDKDAVARIPWPQSDPEACKNAGQTSVEQTRKQIAFHCSGKWDAARLRAEMESARNWAQRHGATVIANEIGVSGRIAAASREAYLHDVQAALAANDIGWALWGYEDAMGLGRQKDRRGRVTVARDVLRGLGLNLG